MSKAVKESIIAAGKRAFHTFAQTFGGVVIIEGARHFADIAWLDALEYAALAAVFSVIKSLAVGMPEVSITADE